MFEYVGTNSNNSNTLICSPSGCNGTCRGNCSRGCNGCQGGCRGCQGTCRGGCRGKVRF
ncbi:MAG: hypothetical protein IJC97_00610 [Oscillospiraceae bacterium]|nr:hypothetical protein [Oscillospiraceae bacterium]